MSYSRWNRLGLVAAGVWLGATVACTTAPLGVPVEPPPAEALSILFVGNSLTYFNDLPEMVQGLLEERDAGSVVVASTSFPGYGLQDHWIEPRTHAAIAIGGWDFVVLQQGPSATEGRPSLLDYTERFNDEILAVGARPALYMVWPAASRAFDFDGVAASYAMAAERVGGELFPAGEAWRAAWRTDPAAAFYGPDGFHPSVLGSYLAALTIADRLAGGTLDPSYRIATASVNTSFDPEYGAFLLAAAREANAMYP